MSPMPLKLYELVGTDPSRPFSPFCWRTRMALAHKGLSAETIPWCFTEKSAIAPWPAATRRSKVFAKASTRCG